MRERMKAVMDAMKEQARSYGPPVRFSNEDRERFLDDQRKILDPKREFALAVDVRNGSIVFSHGIFEAIGKTEEPDLGEFFEWIAPSYLRTYLHWAMAAYRVAADPAVRLRMGPGALFYLMRIPLYSEHEHAYVEVTQRASPLQVDAAGNLLVHYNIYQIGLPAIHKVPLFGHIESQFSERSKWLDRLHGYVTESVWRDPEFLPDTMQRRVLKRYGQLYSKNGEVPTPKEATEGFRWKQKDGKAYAAATLKKYADQARAACAVYFGLEGTMPMVDLLSELHRTGMFKGEGALNG